MAKGNLLLGMGRGKLGDIVLSRAYGQQISRARAKVVKNPKTKGQQVQRIILATVTKAYSQMKSIVNHSWQGVSYGAASMNKFNQLNMDFLRNQLGANGLDNDSENPADWAWFICPENQLAVPNRFAIARGTLPTVIIGTKGTDLDNVEGFVVGGESVTFAAAPSYEEFTQRLGIEIGDQLTLCIIDNYGKFHYGRFICSANDGDNTNVITDRTKWNERNVNITVSYSTSFAILNCADMDVEGTAAAAAGMILSRKQGTTWQRSNSDMIIWDRDFSGIGDSMNDALYEVETGALDFSSPYYLNNANQKNTASGEGGDENP